MAEITGANIHYNITADSKGFKENIEEDKRALNSLGESAAKASSIVSTSFGKIDKTNIKDAKKMLKDLETEMKHWSDMSKKTTDKDMLEQYNAELEDVKKSYEELSGAIKSYEQDNVSLKSQYREVIEQMSKLALAGEKNSEEYANLVTRAGQLKDAMIDVGSASKSAASDTMAMDASLGALSLGTSAVEALTGVMGMFTTNTEAAAEMQTKLQSAMALAQGVQQAQLALQKESALMIGIGALQRKASATAITLETKAKSKNIVVSRAATIAQKAFNAVANANPYVLMATAIISVVGAMAALAVANNRVAESQKKVNEMQSIYLDGVERNLSESRRQSDERLRDYENELTVAKSKLNNEKEVYAIEDKIYKEKKKQIAAEKSEDNNYRRVENLDFNRDYVEKLEKQLDTWKKAQADGKKKIKVDIDLDGKVETVKLEKAIEIQMARIENKKRDIEIGASIVANEKQVEADRKAQQEARAREYYERAKANKKVEREMKEQEEDLEIEASKWYNRAEKFFFENEQRRLYYERMKKDLEDKLTWENSTLTKASKASIKRQKDLIDAIYEKEQENFNKEKDDYIKSFEEDIRARRRALTLEDASTRKNNLWAEYYDKKAKLDREQALPSTSENRVAEIDEEIKVLLEEYLFADRKLNREIASERLANAVSMWQARIDAEKEGSKELLELNKKLIDAQLEQEIDSINNNLKLTDEEKKEFIELAEKKAQIAKEKLVTDEEVEKYKEIGKYANDIADALDTIAGGIESESLKFLIRSFKEVAKLADKIADSLELVTEDGKTSIKGIDMNKIGPDLFASAFSMVLNNIVNSVQEMQHMNALTEEWINSLELAKYQLEDIYSNAFGEDVYKRSLDAAKKNAEATKAYQDAINDANEQGKYWGWSNGNYGRHRGTRAQNMKGTGRNTLQEIAPELFDENGEIRMDKLETFLSTFGDDLDETTKKYLENLLELKNATEDLTDEMTNYLSSTFGSLGDSLMDSIVDAVMTGSRSWSGFERAGREAIEGLIKQMAYSTFLAPIFSEYESELDNLAKKKAEEGWSEDEYLNRQMNLMSEYLGKLEGGAQAATEWVRDQARNGSMSGLFAGETEKSVAGAISTVTEQTASIIAGQMNAIRMNQIDTNGMLREQLMVLSGIKSDTFYIKKIYDVVAGGQQFSTRMNA